MLSPAKIKIVKVTTRTSVEKKLLRALHDHSEIEFIDVEKKGLGSGVKVSESEDEKEILQLLSKFSSMVDSLNLFMAPGIVEKRNLDYEDLSDTLKECQKVFDRTSPVYEEIMSHLSESQRRITELNTLVETSKILKPLKIEFSLVGEGKYFTIITGSIGTDKLERLEWNLKELTDNSIIFNSSRVEGEKNLSAVVIGAMHKFTDDINRVLASFGFVELNIPVNLQGNPSKIQADSLAEISKLEEEVSNWEAKKDEFIKQNTYDLLSVREQLSIEKERIEVKRLMRQDKYVLQFWGYVPDFKVKETEQLVKSVDPEAIFEIESKNFHDHDYPTRLENHKRVGRPYEPMVNLYGTPEYGHDYDPSTLIALTFPIFFGIMFADIFHGFLLILIGYFAMKMKPLGREPDGMVEVARDYLKKGDYVLFLSGIASFICGFLFWSFAGFHGEHAPSFMQPGGLLWPLHVFWLFSDDTAVYPNVGEHALNTMNFAGANGQFLFLQLSLVIGILHITAAIFLLLINKIRQGHYVEAFFFPLMLLIAYVSASLLVFSYGLNFISWFDPGNFSNLGMSQEFTAAILTPLIGFNSGIYIPKILAWVSLVSILAFVFYELKTMGVSDGISLAADFAISLLGNTVSYARLFAINLVHAILATLVYLVFLIPHVIPFDSITVHLANGETEHVYAADPMQQFAVILAFIGGTVLVISFELMVTFLQALRLHIVEFFSKMHFSGTGRLFVPFKASRFFTNPVELELKHEAESTT